MSSYLMPEFSGTDVEVERETVTRTNIFETVSGKEQRVTYWSTPRYRYRVRINALRENVILTTGSFSGSSEPAALLGLYELVSGSFDSFLMRDPYTGTTGSVRFVEESLSLTRVVPGIWEAEFQCITVK